MLMKSEKNIVRCLQCARVIMLIVTSVAASSIPVAVHAQTTLYGITGYGDLYEIDKASGNGTFIGYSGFGANAAASDSQNRIITGGGSSAGADLLVQVDPNTGTGSPYLTLANRPGGFGIRGLAFNSSDELFALMSKADTSAIDILTKINTTTGQVSLVGTNGETEMTGIQGLAFDGSDNLFGVNSRTLVEISTSTAVASAVGGFNITPDEQALEFDMDGTLYSARVNLKTIDPSGNASLVGATGIGNIRGLAIIPEPASFCLLVLGGIVASGYGIGSRKAQS